MNLLVYLPLGWLLAPRAGLIRTVLTGCGLSLGIEYLQAFVPGRFPSMLDWALNTAGTLLGALFASYWRQFPWPHDEPILVPGPRARLGITAVGTWAGAQLFPFVPSVDVDYLKEGLRPVWHVLQGRESFSLSQASVYALATLALSTILEDCLRPNPRFRVLVPLGFFGVLLAKVPIISRQLSLEALAGAAFGLLASRRLSDPKNRSRAAFLATAGAVLVDGLRSEGAEAGLVPFNWILFRTHLTNELIGASDLMAGVWPFLALAFLVSGWRGVVPRRAAAAGAAAVFVFVFGVEWMQQFLPGRTPDVTDAVVASGAWVLAWVGISRAPSYEAPSPSGGKALGQAPPPH